MRTGSLRTVTPLRQTVSQTTGTRAAYTRKTVPGLRLTRRGRVVAAAAAALVISTLMAVAAGAAQAAGSGHGGRAGRQAESTVARMTVRPGDSLWSVAQRAAPDADARIVIQEIVQLNKLPGTVIYPGEQLLVPRN